ncbi:E3 ubiquitin-protein ligase MBR2-like [Quillaja saponaria]|uniref:RING-type E3 ubiquitin transferase n=1 Tax=Quillaja saponaria TaxID=32244 RepID=A0AAD7L7D4_QUISA|nr:E3 ubiquitin-protein ligase MBR2-like [Quillaja saponaria]
MMTNQGWSQSSSNSDTQNEVSPQESFGVLALLSSPSALTGTGQRSPERHPESICYPLQGSVNIIPSNGHGVGLSPRCIDVNEGNTNSADQDTPLHLTPHSFESDGTEDQNLPARNSSASLVITSGVENNVLEGHSADRRCLPCKRKAPENAFRGLSIGESSSSAFQTGNHRRKAIPSQDNANSILNISTPYMNPPNVSHHQQLDVRVGSDILGAVSSMQQQLDVRVGSDILGAVSSMQHTFNEARQAESFQGNTHRQTAANLEGLMPPSIFSATTRNSRFQLLSQPTMFSQYHPCANLSLGQVPLIATPPVQPFMHVPNSLETMQSSPWIDTTRSRVSMSTTSLAYTENGGYTLGPSEILRNMPRNTTLALEAGRRNWAHNVTNLSFINGTADFAVNVASTSHSGSGSRTQLAHAPTWVPQHNLAEQHAQRLSGIATPISLQPLGQGSDNSFVSGTSAASRPMGISISGGNARTQTLVRSGMATRFESQAGRYPRIHPALWSVATVPRRNRQVQNTLAFLRRGGSLQLEDLMVIDRSLLFNLPEEDDMHDGMRLDIDNMSYEELLALEEQIGNVCVGLSEKAIAAHLRRQKYQFITVETQEKDESCCICQEEYIDGEDLGNLDCGHKFHFTCIKQWLVQKNTCPICKMTALAVTDKDH